MMWGKPRGSERGWNKGICGATRAPEWNTQHAQLQDPAGVFLTPALGSSFPSCPHPSCSLSPPTGTECILTPSLPCASNSSALHPHRLGGGWWPHKICLEVSKCQMSARCEVRARRPASWGVGGVLSGERKKGFILFFTPLGRSLLGESGGTI